jgi:surfactin synthase thioesterase subunit
LPYAGSGASLFRTWTDEIAEAIEICPIQLPGRENRLRESPFADLSLLSDVLVKALSPYLDMPYALFGHSMGALISFEVCRRLEQSAVIPPMHLFVSGRSAPDLPDPHPVSPQLPDDEFIGELRRLQGTTEEVLENREFLQMLLPLLRADFTLSDSYVYTEKDPLSCPITAFGGFEDIEAPPDMLHPWAGHTRNSFEVHFYHGKHFFILDEYKSMIEHISGRMMSSLTTDGPVKSSA